MSRVLRFLCRAAPALVATPALAHSPIPGIGTFYSGALHPFVAPALLIGLLAFGLQTGQAAAGDPSRLRRPMAWFGGALLLGLLGSVALGELDTDRLLLFLGALCGGATAAAWQLPDKLRLSLGVAMGLATGLASAPSGVTGGAYAAMVAGSVLASLMLPLWVGALMTLRQPAWANVVARVLGSWLAAAALLVLSLSFAPAKRSVAAHVLHGVQQLALEQV